MTLFLRKKNGLDMGYQHFEEHGFHIYSALIAGNEREKRTQKLHESRYFGILSDGTPGKHDKVEHENVHVRYLDHGNGKPENVFVGLNALQHQDHAGIIAGIEEER